MHAADSTRVSVLVKLLTLLVCGPVLLLVLLAAVLHHVAAAAVHQLFALTATNKRQGVGA